MRQPYNIFSRTSVFSIWYWESREGLRQLFVHYESILPEAVPGVVYELVDFDVQVVVVVDVPLDVSIHITRLFLNVADCIDAECSGGIQASLYLKHIFPVLLSEMV